MKSAGAIRAGRAFVELFADDSRMNKDLKRARGRLSSFAKHANAIGRTMVAAFVAIAAPIALATNVFAGFEDQMAEVRAVTQATTGDFAKLNDQAKLLGRTTSFTASQVASAQAELGRAGFDPDDILKSTSSVLDLSRATKTELSEAASIAADSLRGFRLEAAQMPRVVDVLTATTINSSQGLGDLFEALKLIAPVAADVDMSVESTAAAIGILANNGIKGSMAGTALKRALLNLADPATRKKLKDLTGVLAVDESGNLRNIAHVIAEIGEKTRSLPNADRVSIFAELFGDRAVVAASNLANADAQFGELLKTLEDSQGVSAKTAEMMDQTFGGSLRRMWSAVEGVSIAVGEKLTPYLVVAVDWFSDVANRVTVLITENEGLVIAATATVAAIGATGTALMAAGTAAAATATGITAVTKTTAVLAPTMKVLQTQAILMETTLTGLIAKQLAWNAAMLAGKGAAMALVAVASYRFTRWMTDLAGLTESVDKLARALHNATEEGRGLNNTLSRMRGERQERQITELEQIEDPTKRKNAIDAAVEKERRNQAGIELGIQQARDAAQATRDAEADRIAGHGWGERNPLAVKAAEYSQVVKDADARVAELEEQKKKQDEFVNDLLKLQADTNRAIESPGSIRDRLDKARQTQQDLSDQIATASDSAEREALTARKSSVDQEVADLTDRMAQRQRQTKRPNEPSDYDRVKDALMSPIRVAGDELGKQIKQQLPAWMTGPKGITAKQGINAIAAATDPWKSTNALKEQHARRAHHDFREPEQQSPAVEERKKRFDDIRDSLQVRQVALSASGAFGTDAATGLKTDRTIEQQEGQKVTLDEKAMEYLRQIAENLSGEVL